MRSISAKIMFWSLGALVLSLAAFFVVSQMVAGRALLDTLMRANDFEFQLARQTFESGGTPALSRYLDELNQFIGAEYHLTDAKGQDLRTGEDHSPLIRQAQGRGQRRGDRLIFGKYSSDGRYGWVQIVKPPFSMTIFTPFYLLVLATVMALYWLARGRITTPLCRLASVVDRFGHGEWDARAATASKDEIGDLGRSFNAMADRIQTLLTAERQLLQDVSHELRSPLARLTFETEMVRRTADRDVSADRLRREIDRLSELVCTLIDMARLEGDPSAVPFEEVPIDELLREIAADCEVEAFARGCGITVRASESVRIPGNLELLRRAFENVVRNAIRYSPAGTQVEVSLRCAGGSVAIEVRDYGPGVHEQMIARIFDPFFRADSSRDESTGGLGLGLAIARRALRAHHGDITAENANPGALLTITLPAGE